MKFSESVVTRWKSQLKPGSGEAEANPAGWLDLDESELGAVWGGSLFGCCSCCSSCTCPASYTCPATAGCKPSN